MKHIFKIKSVWVYCVLSLVVLISISIILMICIPNNFLDNFLEFISTRSRKDTWVLLVAGSNGWLNYRHQADIAHAYQILLSNGIPAKYIVVMMADDVANDTQNPYPGKLFNSFNGLDVYQGLQIDYSGKDVSSNNFLHILSGNKAAMKNIGSSRVIDSKHRDNIFVNFVGHGTTGILGFPDSYLYADELNNVLQTEIKNKFNKMLFYVEACRAGSLFDGILGETSNIFTVTAAGPRESSWPIYCIDNTTTNICLGDEFSITWIEDQAYSKSIQLVEKRTVLNHFNYIRNKVKLSNVMPYGDFRVGLDKLSLYIGKSPESNSSNIFSKNSIKLYKFDKYINEKNMTIKQWKQQINYNNTMKQIMDKLFNEILLNVIRRLPSIIKDIKELKEFPRQLQLNAFPCYRQTLDHITKNCFSLPKNIYTFKTVHVFFNLCSRVIENNEIKPVEFDVMIGEVIFNVCSETLLTFSNLHEIKNIN